MDPVALLEEILPKSQHKKIERIVEALALEDVQTVDEVAVIGARVPVEHVTAYGLEIAVDANGNAVTVGFPYGGELL
jgi:predicted transcriptional regulator